MQNNHQHITALQSARGIAATVVVIHHCLYTFDTTGPLKEIAVLSRNGATAAVVFFFVLSGLVLTLSLQDKPTTTLTVLKFYVRRAWRIYPALWVACALGLFYAVVLHPLATAPQLTSWFVQRFEPEKLNAFYIVASFAALIPFLVPPAWSIFVELAGSAFLPLIAFASRKRALLTGLFLAFLALGFAFPNKGYNAGMYLIDFVIGAAIIGIAPLLAPFLRKWRGLPAAVLTIFYMGAFDNGQPPAHHVLALSAALLICTILSRPGWKFLDGRFLARIGDISYSIYILHFPIMCTIATFLSLTVRASSNQLALILVAATVIATWGASELVYRFVELPGIRGGKTFSKAIFSRWNVPARTVDDVQPRNP